MNFFLSAHPTTASTSDVVIILFFFVGVFVLYLLRDAPGFKLLWFIVRTFLLVVLATLAIGFIKDKISDK